MSVLVVQTAQLQCTFGAAPSALMVVPHGVMAGGMPAANVMDHAPMANIMPFGMCKSPTNPTVAAATAAAMGVPHQMPCVPVTSAPWMPGVPTVTVGGLPAVSNTCKLMCIWMGGVSVSNPGQMTAIAR